MTDEKSSDRSRSSNEPNKVEEGNTLPTQNQAEAPQNVQDTVTDPNVVDWEGTDDPANPR